MKISEMTNQHISNAIRYWKRQLEAQPEQILYMGDSEYAEQVVECENNHNEQVAENIKKLIKRLQKEALQRNL